ncbi:hypothetical protein HPB49_012121 [Dermacentor silvarum]|uniref:Uncharacterized protein n=1 Tax=Dermacentor silvarum TaxID=543639 RepID=A0ACB8C3G0_DERSI|nr:hypothetical protein HPB49_012121 [Dermacentor silvarum]
MLPRGFVITLLQNKLSVFYITILSIAACGGGVIAGAFCPNIIWMTVAVGGLYGMGFGATITCFSMYTLAYFDKYRATATAVKYAAWSAAGLTGPSIMSFLAGYYGLNGALLLSGAFIIQGAPLVLLLRRPRPFIIWRNLRSAASNDDSSANMTKPHQTSECSSPIPSSQSFTEAPTTQLQDTGLCVALSKKNVSALFHTLDFYILVAFLVLFDWSTSVHSTTAVDYGQTTGAPLEKAKFVLTTTAFGYLVGRTVVPFAADRIPFSRAPFAVAALATSFLTFLVPSMIESFDWFVALNMILGICQGYVSCIRGVLISEYLGIHRLPVMAGFTGLFLVPLSTSGPTIVGK